ncbi:MAG: type IV secretory system conjugative DNA transfer family protein, partial [Pseudomonadota bacterium]
ILIKRVELEDFITFSNSSPRCENGITHRYNPIDDIVSLPKARQFTEARRLSVNLITAKNKSAEGFLEGARDLFAAGVVCVIERGTPTVGAIYNLFSQPGDKSDVFIRLAIESQSEEARRIFDNMAGNDLKIITSYTSVLGDGGLNLWADPLVQAATENSDFNIRTLRSDPCSIYLCVNANDIVVLSPLMRLLFQQMISTMQSRLPEKDDVFEVLFLLDEFKSLGKMSLIETAVTTLAGFGGRFMFVVQNLSNLTEVYGPSGKENFLGNCGVQVFMATADADTPQYISKAIGDFTRKSRSKSWATNDLFSGYNIQEREEGSRLIRPEEIRLLPNNEEIVLLIGEPPLRLQKIRYYEDKVFKKAFEQQKGDLPLPEALPITRVQPKVMTTPTEPKTEVLVEATDMPDVKAAAVQFTNSSKQAIATEPVFEETKSEIATALIN